MSEKCFSSAAQHRTPEAQQEAVAQDGRTEVAASGVSAAAAPPNPPGEPADFIAQPDCVQDEVDADATTVQHEASEHDQAVPAGANEALRTPPLVGGPRRRQRLFTKPDDRPAPQNLTATQRLLLLDTWLRSGLPAADFAALVGVSKHTLYLWKKRFDHEGPGGLMERPRGASGSKLPELTRRTILMLKQANPDWGCQRISDMLVRGPALPASAKAVARVLREAGYTVEQEPTRPHAPPVHHFERAGANELWQTDLFTFVLKRQNRRVYLVAFLDDHSRFITSYGLHTKQSRYP